MGDDDSYDKARRVVSYITVNIGKAKNKGIDFICHEREFSVYDSIRDNFPKYVVSMDELDMSRNGIRHRNIRDFLLMEKWD